LITDLNLVDADLVYTDIIDAHRDLTDAESQDLNARLILILANHIGDRGLLAEAIALARRSMDKPAPSA
jgi:hypothetical protein